MLNELNLEKRIDLDVDNYYEIDYKDVRKKIKLLRDDTKKWVLEALDKN